MKSRKSSLISQNVEGFVFKLYVIFSQGKYEFISLNHRGGREEHCFFNSRQYICWIVMDSDLNLQNLPTTTLKISQEFENSCPTSDLEKVVHTFIFRRLDYCNSVFTGLSKKAIGQLIQLSSAHPQCCGQVFKQRRSKWTISHHC